MSRKNNSLVEKTANNPLETKPKGFLSSISSYVHNITDLYKHLVALVGVEFDVAVQKGVSIILLALLSLVLLGSTWILLLGGIAWFLWQQNWPVYLILIIETAINITLLLSVLLKIAQNKKYLLFTNTRKHWNSLTQ